MHKIAFYIGSWPVHWYGILVASGFLAGLWTSANRARRVGVSSELVWDISPWLLLGGLLGGRLWFVGSYWDTDFAGRPWSQIFMIQQGGLVFYGGFIGATTAGILFVRRHRLPLWKVADILAPGLALGYAIGRFGCLMTGCCYGKVCSLPWAIHFPPPHDSYPNGVHPTQIYDAGLNLLLAGFLDWLHRRRKFDGQIFSAWLILYAISRSTVEIFRGDYPVRYIGGNLTPAHLLSIVIVAIGIALWSWRRRFPLANASAVATPDTTPRH